MMKAIENLSMSLMGVEKLQLSVGIGWRSESSWATYANANNLFLLASEITV